jgi:plasmid stability protein
MSAINIRNLSPETHRALRARAASNGRSMEAEARVIIDEAVRPAERLGLGTALVALFRPLVGIELDIARDPAPRDPVRFDD